MDPDKDLDMMRNPDSWPCWPFLPLKRWVNQRLSHGFLAVAVTDPRQSTEPDAKVFNSSIYMVRPDTPLSTLDCHDYGTLEQVRADGWVVD